MQQLIVEALPITLEAKAAGKSVTVDFAGPECWTWTWNADGTDTKVSEPREQVHPHVGATSLPSLNQCRR